MPFLSPTAPETAAQANTGRVTQAQATLNTRREIGQVVKQMARCLESLDRKVIRASGLANIQAVMDAGDVADYPELISCWDSMHAMITAIDPDLGAATPPAVRDRTAAIAAFEAKRGAPPA
jgi:hypothetical protein